MRDKKKKKVDEVVDAFNEQAKNFDPQGSYTGEDIGEDCEPIQDSDDL